MDKKRSNYLAFIILSVSWKMLLWFDRFWVWAARASFSMLSARRLTLEWCTVGSKGIRVRKMHLSFMDFLWRVGLFLDSTSIFSWFRKNWDYANLSFWKESLGCRYYLWIWSVFERCICFLDDGSHRAIKCYSDEKICSPNISFWFLSYLFRESQFCVQFCSKFWK